MRQDTIDKREATLASRRQARAEAWAAATKCSVPPRNRAFICLDGREHVAAIDLIPECGHSRAYCAQSGAWMIELIEAGRIRCGDCFAIIRNYTTVDL